MALLEIFFQGSQFLASQKVFYDWEGEGGQRRFDICHKESSLFLRVPLFYQEFIDREFSSVKTIPLDYDHLHHNFYQ